MFEGLTQYSCQLGHLPDREIHNGLWSVEYGTDRFRPEFLIMWRPSLNILYWDGNDHYRKPRTNPASIVTPKKRRVIAALERTRVLEAKPAAKAVCSEPFSWRVDSGDSAIQK